MSKNGEKSIFKTGKSKSNPKRAGKMNTFENQVAVITGAASGLGLVIAHKLLNEGARIGLLDLNEQALNDEFVGNPEQEERIGVDVTDEQRVAQAVARVAERFGKIDILINCAGITGATNIKSHEVDTANLQKVFNINFMASFYTAKAVLPYMLQNNYGRILHVASIAGKEGNAGMLAAESLPPLVIRPPVGPTATFSAPLTAGSVIGGGGPAASQSLLSVAATLRTALGGADPVTYQGRPIYPTGSADTRALDEGEP